MFATPNLFSTAATWIDMDDTAFFAAALDHATCAYEKGDYDRFDVDTIKRYHTPVVYASRLSKMTKDDKKTTGRKELNASGRMRRSFIMIDADFNPGEEADSYTMRRNMKQLADAHNTHLVIYPTVSWPEKPRFRAVMFPARDLNARGYHKAVTWWYKKLGYDTPLDAADTRINANRNLPVFINDEQIENVYSTLDDDTREKLPGHLWRDISAPSPSSSTFDYDTLVKQLGPEVVDNLEFQPKKLARQCTRVARRLTDIDPTTYNGTWRILQGLAIEVMLGTIPPSLADDMCDILASAADTDSQRAQWAEGNKKSWRERAARLRVNADPAGIAEYRLARMNPFSHAALHRSSDDTNA